MSDELVLGFDFGLRRIGVAVGNRLTRTARALNTVACPSAEADWKPIDTLVGDWQPARLLVGIPRHMDETEQHITQRAREFAGQLTRRYALPVEQVDERLSSASAESDLREARRQGRKSHRNRPGELDGLAAAVIVSQWLET